MRVDVCGVGGGMRCGGEGRLRKVSELCSVLDPDPNSCIIFRPGFATLLHSRISRYVHNTGIYCGNWKIKILRQNSSTFL